MTWQMCGVLFLPIESPAQLEQHMSCGPYKVKELHRSACMLDLVCVKYVSSRLRLMLAYV